MKLLDLFAGIGGFSLAAHWMGWETVAFVEKDEYCQKVLRKNFKDVPIYDDIVGFSGEPFRGVDFITGGFPCQDVSTAGQGVGIAGTRSGLWKHMVRIIRETRPRFVVVENVAVLLGRGMDVVLRDLSESGYDAEWRVCSACELGAPHSRERVFIVAYPSGQLSRRRVFDRYCEKVIERHKISRHRGKNWNGLEMVPDPVELVSAWNAKSGQPPLMRMVDGIPDGLDGPRCYGNSIVPEIAHLIFQSIDESFRLTD